MRYEYVYFRKAQYVSPQSFLKYDFNIYFTLFCVFSFLFLVFTLHAATHECLNWSQQTEKDRKAEIKTTKHKNTTRMCTLKPHTIADLPLTVLFLSLPRCLYLHATQVVYFQCRYKNTYMHLTTTGYILCVCCTSLVYILYL